MRRLTLALLLALAANARAQLTVHDPIHTAVNLQNWIVTETKQAAQYVKEADTELHTLESYENSIIALARMGDPAALRNLPVIGSVAALVGDGQRLLSDYNQIRDLTSPQYMQGQLGSVVSTYNLSRWNPMYPGAYQFPSSAWTVSQTVQMQMEALEKERQTVEAELQAAVKALAAATDQSTAQKQQGAIAAAHATLTDIAARSAELAQHAQLQQMQLNAGQAVQTQQANEQRITQDNAVIDQGLSNLPIGQMQNHPMLWNDYQP